MELKTVAGFGALATVPWIVIEAILYSVNYTGAPYSTILIISLLAITIVGLPLGSLGAVTLLKIQKWIPGKTMFLKATILALIVWVIADLPLSPSGVANYSISTGLGNLVGALVWACVLGYFLRADVRSY